MSNIKKFSSRKEVSEFLKEKDIDTSNWSEEKWLSLNKGQAEIHMMMLSESIYDAMNESTPKRLEAGEWHIPFGDRIDLQDWYNNNKRPTAAFWNELEGYEMDNYMVKISTAMAAKTSYTVIGDEKEVNYEKMLELHDRLIEMRHDSPLEHCARAMSNEEFVSYIKSIHSTSNKVEHTNQGGLRQEEPLVGDFIVNREEHYGWCRNFKGFIQYRHFIEQNGRFI